MTERLFKLQRQISRRITNAKGCLKNLEEEGDDTIRAYWTGRKEALEEAMRLVDDVIKG